MAELHPGPCHSCQKVCFTGGRQDEIQPPGRSQQYGGGLQDVVESKVGIPACGGTFLSGGDDAFPGDIVGRVSADDVELPAVPFPDKFPETEGQGCQMSGPR